MVAFVVLQILEFQFAYGIVAPAAELTLCATDFDTSVCHPEYETECFCRHSGACSKYDRAEEIYDVPIGSADEYYWDTDICTCTYRCRNTNLGSLYCDEDPDCVKDTSIMYDCPYLSDEAVFTGCPCGGCP